MSKTLGDAFVRVRPDTDGFQSEAQSRMGSGLKKMAVAIGGALASREVLRGAKALVDRASDLSETGNKIGVVFGGAQRQVMRFSKGSVDALGQTQQSALDAAATFGVFGKAAGLNNKENAKFSKGLVRLSSDMASFSNTTPEEAIAAIGSALRGEAEPMRAYGVLLDDATLKAEAMRLGLLKPVKDAAKITAAQTRVTVAQKAYNDALKEHGPNSLEVLKAQSALGTAQSTLKKATEGTIPALTTKQKVLAAESAIMKQTKDAQGDFARTSEGFANQQRIAAAQAETLKTKLGQGLLPVFTAGAQVLTTRVMPPLIDLANKWVPKVSKEISAWIKNAPIDKYLDIAGNALGRVQGHLSGMDTSSAAGTFESMKTALKDVDWAGAGASIGSMGDSVKKLAPAFKDIDVSKVNDALSVTAEVMAYAADHTDELGKLLPWLAGGFIALKVAQALANAAALISLPMKVAEIVVNRQLLKSNKALVASRAADTVAVTANTAVTKIGTAATLGQKIAAVASAAAQKAVAAATWVWTGAQKALNLAMKMNPIGLVITALTLLVTGLILAYKKSETFRNIVDGAFRGVAAAGRWLWNEVLQPVFKFLVNGFATVMDFYGRMLDGLARVPGFGWAKKAADGMHAAADKARDLADGIKKIPPKKTVRVNVVATTEYSVGRRRGESGSPEGMFKGRVEFDSGGLARGTGYMPKKIIRPERVLSPRQTAAFEELVDMLSGGIPMTAAAGGGGHTFNHYGDIKSDDPRQYLRWNQRRSRHTGRGGVEF